MHMVVVKKLTGVKSCAILYVNEVILGIHDISQVWLRQCPSQLNVVWATESYSWTNDWSYAYLWGNYPWIGHVDTACGASWRTPNSRERYMNKKGKLWPWHSKLIHIRQLDLSKCSVGLYGYAYWWTIAMISTYSMNPDRCLCSLWSPNWIWHCSPANWYASSWVTGCEPFKMASLVWKGTNKTKYRNLQNSLSSFLKQSKRMIHQEEIPQKILLQLRLSK